MLCLNSEYTELQNIGTSGHWHVLIDVTNVHCTLCVFRIVNWVLSLYFAYLLRSYGQQSNGGDLWWRGAET